jgi:hypothetical protein
VPKRQDHPDRAQILLRGPGKAWWHDESGTPITRRSHTAQLRSLCVLLDSAIEPLQVLANPVKRDLELCTGPKARPR